MNMLEVSIHPTGAVSVILGVVTCPVRARKMFKTCWFLPMLQHFGRGEQILGSLCIIQNKITDHLFSH